MATKQLTEREAAVLDVLPASGEVSFEQWKSDIAAAGLGGDTRLVQTLRRKKAVNYRVVFSDDQRVIVGHMVSRAVPGQGGSTASFLGGD